MAFCKNCGLELPVDAKFCPRCGLPVTPTPPAPGAIPPPPPAPPPTPPRREKEEKREREEREKREKRENGEKQEKAEKRGDRWGAIIGGLILLLIGVSLYLAQTGVIGLERWWAYVLTGIGVILIAQALIRYSTATYKGSVWAPLFGGAVLVIIGLTAIARIRDWWPIALIVAGAFVIVYGLTAYRRSPKPT